MLGQTGFATDFRKRFVVVVVVEIMLAAEVRDVEIGIAIIVIVCGDDRIYDKAVAVDTRRTREMSSNVPSPLLQE